MGKQDCPVGCVLCQILFQPLALALLVAVSSIDEGRIEDNKMH